MAGLSRTAHVVINFESLITRLNFCQYSFDGTVEALANYVDQKSWLREPK